MYLGISRRLVPVLAALLLVVLFVVDTSAQKRRTRRSRRVTNPVTATAPSPTATPTVVSSEPRIISTAEDQSNDSGAVTPSRRNSGRRSSTSQSGEEGTRDKVDKLTAQISALTEKLNQMEQQQRTLVDLERLSRAETRAEMLRSQLRDVQSKEAELTARTLQLDYEMQPAVIERTLAASGSTRPEDLREQRRRQLETEKNSTQVQLNQLATSRARLETAIANADAEADRLRARIDNEPATTDPAATDVAIPIEPTTEPVETGEGRP